MEDSHRQATTQQHQNPGWGRGRFGSFRYSNPLPWGPGQASPSLSQPAAPQGASLSVQVASGTTSNTRTSPPPDHQAPGPVCRGRQCWTWEEPTV